MRHEGSGAWLPVDGGVQQESGNGPMCDEAQSIVVNIGKQLAESAEVAGRLPLAWHRVPGLKFVNSVVDAERLAVEATHERHSIAYFVQEQQYHDLAGKGIKPPSDNTPTRHAGASASHAITYAERNQLRAEEAAQAARQTPDSTCPQAAGLW